MGNRGYVIWWRALYWKSSGREEHSVKSYLQVPSSKNTTLQITNSAPLPAECIVALKMNILMEYFVLGAPVVNLDSCGFRQENCANKNTKNKNKLWLLWSQVCLVFMSLLIVTLVSPSCRVKAVKRMPALTIQAWLLFRHKVCGACFRSSGHFRDAIVFCAAYKNRSPDHILTVII